MGIFRGSFGNTIGNVSGSDYASNYEGWDAGTWTIYKELNMPVADIDTPSGEYTFLIAESNGDMHNDIVDWFIS